MATSDSFTDKTSSDEGIVFTFTWKIDNISLYKGTMDTELSSPFFEIGTERTKFQIYLNSGPWSKKQIMARIPGDIQKFPAFRDQISELTLLRDDGEVIESFNTTLVLHCCGRCLYPNPTLFSNEKVLSLFLPQNSLTIRWKIYNLGSGECFFRTVFHQKIFRWNIRDFSKRATFTKLFQLSSLYFTIDLSKLQRSPSGMITMIRFIPSDQDSLNFGNCTVTAVEKEIIYRYGEVNILHNKHIPRTIYSYDDPKVSEIIPPWSWEAPVMLNSGVCKLIKNDDTLSLQWDFTVGIDEIWNGNDPHTNRNVTTCPTKADTLRSDLLRLYEDKKFCDVTLRTRNATFPVHKSVLCARSPVFCAMFESDNEESQTGVVHIQDIRPDTLEQMLRFLYRDSLGDMSWEMAAALYYAADKYRIQALKDKCVSVLIENVSVANACDALVLADTHQDEVLMQAVKDFVFDHDDVVCSVQWKELEKKNPSLAVQFFRDMYLRKKT